MSKQKQSFVQKVVAVETQCQCVPALVDPVYARLYGPMSALMALLDDLKNYSVEQDYQGVEMVNILITFQQGEHMRFMRLCQQHKVGVGEPYEEPAV